MGGQGTGGDGLRGEKNGFEWRMLEHGRPTKRRTRET